MAEPHGASAGPRLRRAEGWAIALVIAFVAVFAAVMGLAGDGRALAHVAGLELGLVAGLLALSLVNYATRLVRWQVFSRRLGVALPLSRTALYYVAGFAMTPTPGKVGEVLRLWLMRRGHGMRYERTASLLVADRLSDLAGVCLLCLAGVAVATRYLGLTVLAAALMVLLTLLFLRPALLIGLAGAGYRALGRWPRLFARLRAAVRPARRLNSWQVFGGTLVLAAIGWFAEGLAFHWLLVRLGADIGLMQSVFIFAFAMLVGALVMLPGGLGGAEASMVGLLLATGVALDIAIAATAVIRLTTLWFAVGLGFLVLPLALRAANRPVATTQPARTAP